MSNEVVGSVSTGTDVLTGNVSTSIGVDGKSAYEVAVDNGFEGTEAEWLESLKAETGTITPEMLDREYWQRNTVSNITGYDYFESILNQNNAAGTITKIEFSGLSPVKAVVGEGNFFVLVSNDLTYLSLFNALNGDLFKYEAGSLKLIKNAKTVLLGVLSSISELRNYTFSEDELYHFYASAQVGSLVGSGYCFTRYEPETNGDTGALVAKMLTVFNFSTLKTFKLRVEADDYTCVETNSKVNADFSSYASLSPVFDEDKLVYQCAEEYSLKSISFKDFKNSLDYVCISLNSLKELYETSFVMNKKYLIQCKGSLAGEFGTNYCEAIFVSSALGEKLTVMPVGNIYEYYVVDLEDETCTCYSREAADGYSPTATVEQTDNGATITITDKDGTTTATVVNGKDGKDGQDGYSPVKGVDYFDGINGADGKDGVSGVYVGSGDMPEGYNVQIDPKGVCISIEDILSDVPVYVANTQFMVGENVLTADKVGVATNWTNNGDTFTHTAGSTEPLRITMGDLAVAGDEWLITFEYTDQNYGEIMLEVSFGDEAKTQCYNGTKDIAVALRVKANGDDLLITPASKYSGTLSNFKIRKITEDGTESFEFQTDTIVNMDRQICKTGFWNVVLGTEHTLTNSPNSSRTIVIGHNALRQLRTGNRNIGIGTYAMSQMESGEQNISIGADSMFEVKKGDSNIVFGKGAASRGTYLENNIVVGANAMAGGDNSQASLNIVLGLNSALNLGKSNSSTASNTSRNIIMGYNAAQEMALGIANVYIGDQCVATNGKNQNTVIGASAKATGEANRSIAIGYQAQTTKANQCVIGGANITEFVLGTKKIIFNDDGTVTWEELS